MATSPSQKPGAPTPEDAGAVQGQGGQALYLRLMTEQLTGWDDPRSMLERALKENLFLLLAQKMLPLKAGLPDPLCYEVLLRLKQEEDNLLPPGGFFDIAESLGMMEQIDRWVVHALLGWAVDRVKKNPAAPLPLLCINVSGAALSSPDFPNAVRSELLSSGVPARTLCFEIGERDVIEHPDAARSFVSALKPLGCRFTLDSFGSIKVSFLHLNGLALDFIKIDGVIVDSMQQGPLGPATIKAINLVCREVGIRTIAEFVETKNTLDRLRELGVDYVQGFGVARPEPLATLS